MEAKNWITIGSVTVGIIGWIFNGYMNRRHEIFKRKMDLRFGMYESCIAVAQVIEKIFQSKDQSAETMEPLAKDFLKKLEQCQSEVLIYGTEFEINQINKVTELAQRNQHLEMKNEFASLIRSVRTSLRKDLKLPNLPMDIER